MHALLEPSTTHRAFERLAGWIAAHCEEAVERAGGVPPTAAVVDGDHAVHVWPLEWEWLHDDAAAHRLWRERLLEEARAVAGRAMALALPGWVADDGTIWVTDPGAAPPEPGWEEVVVAEVADRHERRLMVGLVRRRAHPGVAPWHRAHLPREADPLAPVIRVLR